MTGVNNNNSTSKNNWNKKKSDAARDKERARGKTVDDSFMKLVKAMATSSSQGPFTPQEQPDVPMIIPTNCFGSIVQTLDVVLARKHSYAS